jgi:hypothetical protein
MQAPAKLASWRWLRLRRRTGQIHVISLRATSAAGNVMAG